ncbi:hypothetical protein BIV25_41015 [Streptomyces sp. MUSC 14]|uniref:DUF397 domain-containing protein n=1 Tax=Streptomyces sp. MUSC 14 TaxID=1354889 RepID=UPI0008F59ABF|nr:DUF397 domain-containing protein [Streptomyces sp. MUSC 14]OIJ86549.1 hypothetical protein BIV25_41015 [Streptomyces sp. MUSC 14]
MRAIDLSGVTWRKSSHSNTSGGECIEVSDDLLTCARWRKSSYSNPDGGECVEVSDDFLTGADWRKSSYSNSDGGACLEVAAIAPAQGLVPVRDSKDTTRTPLLLGAPAWKAFVDGVKTG